MWLTRSQRVVGHGSLVERTITCAGTRLRVGFVEAVATETAHRRQGCGGAVMKRIGELIRGGHPLGVLSTGAHGFYEALGWERWRGPTFMEGPDGPGSHTQRRRRHHDSADAPVTPPRSRRSHRLRLAARRRLVERPPNQQGWNVWSDWVYDPLESIGDVQRGSMTRFDRTLVGRLALVALIPGLAWIGSSVAAQAPASTAEPPTTEQAEFFETTIRPLLADNCYRCHSGRVDAPFAGLRLDSRDGLLAGGDSGPALVPGQQKIARWCSACTDGQYSCRRTGHWPTTPSQH